MHNFNRWITYNIAAALLSVILVFISSFALAEERKGVTGESGETTVSEGIYKNMSNAEIIKEIEGEIGAEERVLGAVPELKRQKGKDGKYSYLYLTKDGQTSRLEDLDKDTLRAIVSRLYDKATEFRNEEIMERQGQLEIIKNAHSALPSRPASVPSKPSGRPTRK